MKPKVTLFVNGNILCRDDFSTTTETDLENVTPHAIADNFDLSDALIVNGNLIVDGMDVKSHKIACTGYVVAYGGQMPISERLTEKEKQQLRYYFNHEYWDGCIVKNPTLMTRYNRGRLIGIFGSEIFQD